MAGYVREELPSSYARSVEGNTDSVEDLIQYLKEVYGVVGNFLSLFDDSLECVFFQDSLMKNMFIAFPERVCINCSFEFPDNKHYMLMFICEDSNGKNWVIAVGFMKEFNSNAVEWLLTTFKKQNFNWHRIRSLVLYPDIRIWDLVQEVFPSPVIIISACNGLRAFTNYVSENDECNSLHPDELLCALDLFKRLIFAGDVIEFNNFLNLYLNLSEPLVQYFWDFWWPLKNHWRISLDFNYEQFFKNIDAYLNVLNVMIKECLKEDYSYVGFIKKIFVKLSQQKYEIFGLSVPVERFSYFAFTTEYQICKIFMPYAAQFVLKQLDVSQKMLLPSSSLSEVYTFNHLGMNIKASAYFCQCNFFVYTNLPCGHIFCVRRTNGLVLFDCLIADETWTKQYFAFAARFLEEDFVNSTERHNPLDLYNLSCDQAQQKRTDYCVKFGAVKQQDSFISAILKEKTAKPQKDKSFVIGPSMAQEASTSDRESVMAGASYVPMFHDSSTTVSSLPVENTISVTPGEPLDWVETDVTLFECIEKLYQLARIKFSMKKSIKPKNHLVSAFLESEITGITSENRIPSELQTPQEDKSSVINQSMPQGASASHKISEMADNSSKNQKPEVLEEETDVKNVTFRETFIKEDYPILNQKQEKQI